MTSIKKTTTITCLFAALLFVSTSTLAQDKSNIEDQAQNLKEHLKNDYFSFGMLLQGQADFQPERISGYNGFKASKARFKLSGEFGNKFGYKLQASMISSPAVKDANVYYKPSSQVAIKAGIFKSPFSHEYATGAGSVLFAGRSTVVNQLGLKRQLGVQLDTYTPEKTFRFTGGIFNGNSYTDNSNNDNKFLYMGRVESYLGSGSNQTKLGASVAHESQNNPSYVGEQTSLTTYISTTQNKLLLDGEFIQSWRDPDFGPESNPYGYYVTAGYFVTESSRLLVRWDAFEGDNLAQDTEQVLLGFNHMPNSFTKLKLTYAVPTDRDIEYSNFFAILQIGF